MGNAGFRVLRKAGGKQPKGRAGWNGERTRSIDAGGPARTCQYIGDSEGNARDWAVCGKPSVAGRSYCQEHVEICFQGDSKGKER